LTFHFPGPKPENVLVSAYTRLNAHSFLETVARMEFDSNCLVFAVGCWAAQA